MAGVVRPPPVLVAALASIKAAVLESTRIPLAIPREAVAAGNAKGVVVIVMVEKFVPVAGRLAIEQVIVPAGAAIGAAVQVATAPAGLAKDV